MALFYENSTHARKIEFAFLEDGLRKGGSALYASSMDEQIRILDEMRAFGINVNRYVRSSKLRVHKVPDPALDPDGPLHGFREFLDMTENSAMGPIRQVTRLFDLSTATEVNNSIEVEQLTKAWVEGTQNTLVCSFRMSKEGHPSFDTWFMEMIKDHHGAIFVPTSSEGIAFYFK